MSQPENDRQPKPHEQELVNKISATLQRNMDQIDQQTIDQLADIRQQALQSSVLKKTTLRITGSRIALAASISAAAIIPWFFQQQNSMEQGVNGQLMDQSVVYFSTDPEMLETIDMLAVLGEPLDAI